jgi:hypothetical protein
LLRFVDDHPPAAGAIVLGRAKRGSLERCYNALAMLPPITMNNNPPIRTFRTHQEYGMPWIG